MRKPLLLFTAILYCLGLCAQAFTDSNLPIIVINTGGQTIQDDIKVNVDMGIIDNGPGIRNYMTDPYNDYNGTIGIELRGSTSQQYPKKSYGVETRDSIGLKLNVSLLGMPKENDWILYGAYPDKTLMRNELTYSLFERMQPWSPRHVYCELVMDGQYLGVYSLLERVKRDDDRVDIARVDADDIAGDSLTGGYIIKIDKLTGNSTTTWTSPYQYKLLYQYHDPEDVELTDEQMQYMEDYVTTFEDIVYGPDFDDPATGFRAYTNVLSFIDFFIMQELGRTVDGYRSSSFMYKDKDSKGGKLSCGPMWDFNLSYGNADYCDAYLTTGWQYNFADVCPSFTTEPPAWWPRMLEDTIYTRTLRCRWEHLRAGILNTDSINAWIDSVAAYLDEAQTRNFEKWDILGVYVNWNYFVGDTYEEEIDYLKTYMQLRSEWLDINIPGVCTDVDYIDYEPFDPLAVTPEPEIDAKLFPNPLHTSAKLVFNPAYISPKTLSLYNANGDAVEHIFIPAGKNTAIIERNNLPEGIYVYKLSDEDGVLASGRVVIQ